MAVLVVVAVLVEAVLVEAVMLPCQGFPVVVVPALLSQHGCPVSTFLVRKAQID